MPQGPAVGIEFATRCIEVSYFVYILQCSDESLYVGVTTDIERRENEHHEGRGGVYTASRRPVRLIYSESHRTRHAAVARERQIKRWTAEKKRALIEGNLERVHHLARRHNR